MKNVPARNATGNLAEVLLTFNASPSTTCRNWCMCHRLGSAVVGDSAVHCGCYESCSGQYSGRSKQSVEGSIVTAERPVEQRALWTLVSKDFYHFHYC